MQLLFSLTCISVFAPLLGSLIAGLVGKRISTHATHWITILLMCLSLASAVAIFKVVAIDGNTLNANLYSWAVSGDLKLDVGFQVDNLTAIMMLLVTAVSTLVHIYSVGYMAGDPGNQRFFSYVSLFTFAMLLLVSANNFFQLYAGWEGVGLVSYLLIGFWFSTKAAAEGSLKAFIVNRVGDFGFIIGIAALLQYVGGLSYSTVFSKAQSLTGATITIFPHTSTAAINVICILLFIGAMAKSAQVPLHVWLPESMAGPTPISALIHAATMVTAGVFLVARMSPLFEYSETALSVVLIIGATGALFTGLLAFVEYDIKRVIAYSTMSQLGYMMAANGASAYSAGIFHLLNHGFFKSLLFLSAGSVIIAMHHEQDLRKMGNLKKYLPFTCISFLIGALSLAAIPPFSGFYSKDAIIEAVKVSTIPGSAYAYWCLLLGAFVTSFYIFRAYFMSFHTKERMDEKLRATLKETSWTMRGPLLILAFFSIVLGFLFVEWFFFDHPTLLNSSVFVLPLHAALSQAKETFPGFFSMLWEGMGLAPFWFSVAGIVTAWFVVIVAPNVLLYLQRYFSSLHKLLVKQYYFDAFNNWFFVKGTRNVSHFLFHFADLKLIDHYMVDGTGRSISRIARLMRRLQTGYLYHYAFVMIVGLLVFLFWLVIG